MSLSYQEVYDDWKLKATVMTVSIALLAIGNVLWIGIIQYEKFGGDPQKRSLANMLTSMASIACCIILNNTVSIHLARALYSCLPDFLGFAMVFIRRWLSTMIAIFILEILIYKLLQVYKYYFVAGLNDNFWAVFIGSWTVLASLAFVSIWSFVVKIENPLLDMLICKQHIYQGLSNK